jgi:hypothetical protein
MDYCQDLAYLTDLGNHAMEAITWKMNCEFKVSGSICPPWPRCTILANDHIMHSTLVDKLTKQPQIGKIVHYELCLPHLVKPNQINRYVRGKRITITKDGAKSSNSEIEDYFTPTHMVLYVKNSGHFNQILKT